MRRSGLQNLWLFRTYRETCCSGQSRNYGYSTRIDDNEKTPRTDDNVQGNLLQSYEQKFANLPDYFQLIKLCSNVGITETVASRQYFTTLDDSELDNLGGSCREYTLPRDKRMDPWEHEDRSSF